MFLVWFISVPLLLFLIWAVVTDVKHRRDRMSDHSVDSAARKAKTEAEAKGSEWGAGGV